MAAVTETLLERARREAYETPLDRIDVARPERFRDDTFWPFFERLRREEPVHYCAESDYGPYWSVTKYRDVMHVETHHKIFSSEPAITIIDQEEGFELPMFIAMDPPKHDEQRRVVTPVMAPDNLARLEGTIRERAGRILDNVPRNEAFNWVEWVSVELTAMTLATLLAVPQEDRRKLTYWSDVATSRPDLNTGRELVASNEERRAELYRCLEYFTEVWNARVNAEPGNDLISMLAHGESTRHMDEKEYLGNLLLLIVGGNDTTRNSISGGVLALNENPGEYRKLRENPSHIKSMVPEIIRWQTPLAHMRRRAAEDTELGGKRIRAGEKVVMWYVSANRDEEAIDRPEEFIIDRPNPRQHISFGYGIHRCMGNRLGEMQLRIVWEEILKRFDKVEVVGEPKRVQSSFVKGYEELPVRIPA